MSIKSIFIALLWIAVFLTISYFIGQVTRENMGWYDTLAKSQLTPPRIVFPIVWTALYIMMAVAGSRFWAQRNDANGRRALILFSLYMIINWAWSFIFFDAHLVMTGFFWILLSDLVLGGLIVHLWNHRKRVELALLAPTFLWGVFAAYLNGYIVFAG